MVGVHVLALAERLSIVLASGEPRSLTGICADNHGHRRSGSCWGARDCDEGGGYGRVCSINGNSADVACRQLGYSILAINMGRKHLWVEWIPCGNEEFAVHRV